MQTISKIVPECCQAIFEVLKDEYLKVCKTFLYFTSNLFEQSKRIIYRKKVSTNYLQTKKIASIISIRRSCRVSHGSHYRQIIQFFHFQNDYLNFAFKSPSIFL